MPEHKLEVAEGGQKLNTLFATQDDELKEHLLRIMSRDLYSVVIVDSCEELILNVFDRDFDLIFLDPKLKQLDGVGSLALVKRISTKAPIIVITDNTSYETEARIAETGVYYNLKKPVNDSIATELIRSAGKKVGKMPSS